jgi:hypothetical protein
MLNRMGTKFITVKCQTLQCDNKIKEKLLTAQLSIILQRPGGDANS